MRPASKLDLLGYKEDVFHICVLHCSSHLLNSLSAKSPGGIQKLAWHPVMMEDELDFLDRLKSNQERLYNKTAQTHESSKLAESVT